MPKKNPGVMTRQFAVWPNVSVAQIIRDLWLDAVKYLLFFHAKI